MVCFVMPLNKCAVLSVKSLVCLHIIVSLLLSCWAELSGKSKKVRIKSCGESLLQEK